MERQKPKRGRSQGRGASYERSAAQRASTLTQSERRLVKPTPKGRPSILCGTEPVWNPNGLESFYRSEDKMMAVEIATQPSFAAGRPRKLFEGRYGDFPLPARANYDVSTDGQRFLMTKETEQNSSATQINVVLNWFEELKQKVPTGKK